MFRGTMMHVLVLIVQFAIYRTAYPSPVPPNAMRSRAQVPLLVLLLTFVLLLFVLFSTKWLYIFRRRRAKGTHGSRTTPWSGWYDNLSTSSSRVGKLFMGSSDVKSGFLIGLLGSPSWETRHSAVIVDHRSSLLDPSVSSRKSASGLSLSQGSKSCSSLYCPARSPVPGHVTLVNNTRPMSPPPGAIINRSPLLSDTEYMRLFNGRVSSTYPSGMTSLVNLTTKDLSRPCVARASSASSRGTVQAEYSPFAGKSNLAYKPPSVIPSPTPKSTKEAFLDTGVVLRLQPSSVEQDTQRLPDSFSVALSLPSLVSRFDSTLSIVNEYSSDNTRSQSAPTMPTPSLPSIRLRATYRRSPKIGPSPLPTIDLPPNGRPDSFQLETFSSNRQRHRMKSPPYGTIDLDHMVGLSTRSSVPKKSTDTDSLLDLMSELAQETSAWDSNVFMDDNFKRLIALQHSKPQAPLKEETTRPRRASWRSFRHRKVQHVFTTLEDIPEVDVTEMMPAPTGDTVIHSFWSDEDDDRQFLISKAL